jgi:plastocyanin
MRGLAFGLLLALVATAGCSDDGDDADGNDMPGPSPSGMAAMGDEVELRVHTTGAYPANPGFGPSAPTVPAGALVHVTFDNQDPLPVQHNWVVEGIAGASSDTIGSGDSTSFDFSAPDEPGSFAIYCSIGDHRDRGMESTLTVS